MHDVVGDDHVLAGPLFRSRLATASMMRRLAWCGTNTSMSAGREPGQLDRPQRDRRDLRGGPPEDGLALLVEAAARRGSAGRGSRWRWPCRRALPQATGPMPIASSVARTDHGGARRRRRR